MAEFDEDKKNTREEGICKELKRIVHTVTKWRNKCILR